jgi:hypothetical protein
VKLKELYPGYFEEYSENTDVTYVTGDLKRDTELTQERLRKQVNAQQKRERKMAKQLERMK